jgi:hypothetical protein
MDFSICKIILVLHDGKECRFGWMALFWVLSDSHLAPAKLVSRNLLKNGMKIWLGPGDPSIY